MLFNSIPFAIFFPIVAILYFLLPHRARWLHLLVASCFFYMFFIPKYILILFFIILVDYAAAIRIERSNGKTRKWFLVLSLMSNLGVLIFFKYLTFIDHNLLRLARLIGWNYSPALLSMVLPIGLSFHTFQAMSYTIEVFRGRQAAERHLGIYALYVMFYPQLVAGPIERPQNLIHQFYERHEFEYRRVADGLKLMLWGLFKKIVIADTLALFVNPVYADPRHFGGPALLTATLFFGFQIYCDFSGYSDIAVGTARVMGFRLTNNFNNPYFAASVSDFWRRWHISLSSWFRDYVYIPLGGNRVRRRRHFFNILVVFGLSGLWHGPSWHFVAWGLLNGLYLVISEATCNLRVRAGRLAGLTQFPRVARLLGIAVTFCLVHLAWIFFRVENIHDGMYVVSHLFDGWAGDLSLILASTGFTSVQFTLAVAFILITECVNGIKGDRCVTQLISKQPVWARWLVYDAVLVTIVFFGRVEGTEFIYFQF